MPPGIYRREEPIVRFRKKWKLSTEHFYNCIPSAELGHSVALS